MRADTADAARTWDGALAGWDGGRTAAFLRAYSDAVNRSLLDAWLPAGPLSRVLKTDLFDEAVGEGLYPVLRERAAQVVGIDVSPAVVAAARTRYPLLDARRADARDIPVADGEFDVVVCISTLDHFGSHREIGEALLELRRVLSPGGRLLITFDNGANPLVMLRNALPSVLLQAVRLVPYPVGVTCGPRRLRTMLAEAGFAVEASRGLMHCPRLLARAGSALASNSTGRLLRAAVALERLDAAPTHYLTAQFVAASARRS